MLHRFEPGDIATIPKQRHIIPRRPLAPKKLGYVRLPRGITDRLALDADRWKCQPIVDHLRVPLGEIEDQIDMLVAELAR